MCAITDQWAVPWSYQPWAAMYAMTASALAGPRPMAVVIFSASTVSMG